MKTMPALVKQSAKTCGWLAVVALAAGTLAAQEPAARIRSQISAAEVTPLTNTPRPYAQARFDAGRMAADTRITGVTLVFSRTAAQQADLEALMAAQQNPASPLYHKWLTPEQFGARFGLARSDLEQVEQWLQQQGFSIDYVARARNWVRFSGSAGQVEQAFQTEMHNYKVNGVEHIGPATAPSLPTALAAVVESIHNLTDLRPKPSVIKPRRNYTINYNSKNYTFFDPSDIRLAYGIKSLISSGYDGSGQTIAVMGQSKISTSDITNFQDAAGLTEKTPTQILVPGTGSWTVSSGDEGESDLDLEWAGAIAPGATIYFVSTGGSSSGGVFDALEYAIDNKIGDILTVSYGSCELQLGTFNDDSYYQEAATQGQSIIASSGDNGSTACYGYTNLSTSEQQELAVNYPASSAYVTGVGGTEISSSNDGPSGSNWSSYWNTGSTSGTLATLTQYIPEIAWNDDTLAGSYTASEGGGLSASTGGKSTLYTSQPSWQTSYFTTTGYTNPASSARLVPDIALYSSPDYPGYLFCTSDSSDWTSSQTASCSDGTFLDGNVNNLTIAGGDSFAAPIFAGMTAILNQAKGYTTGQGLLNSELYTLAANSTTYASAFHDVTSGNNYCTAGTTYGYCSSSGATEGYAATTGYDMVTGLGSVDLANLVTAWPAGTSTLISTATTLSAASSSPSINTADNITVTVSSDSGSTTPSGTVSISVNNGTATSYTLTSDGTYVYAFTPTAAGNYSIVAQYSGDSTHAASTGALTLTVSGTSSGSGSFTLAATNVTVSQGSSGSSTLTITPAGGYTGTVDISISTSSSSLQTYGCYELNNSNTSTVSVTGTSAVTATLTIYTAYSDCSSASVSKRAARHRFTPAGGMAASHQPPAPGGRTLPIGLAALAGALFLGLRRRAKWMATLGCLLLLTVAGLAIGCGGGSSSSTSQDVAKGTYTIEVDGADSTSSSIASSTSFTLTVN